MKYSVIIHRPYLSSTCACLFATIFPTVLCCAFSLMPRCLFSGSSSTTNVDVGPPAEQPVPEDEPEVEAQVVDEEAQDLHNQLLHGHGAPLEPAGLESRAMIAPGHQDDGQVVQDRQDEKHERQGAGELEHADVIAVADDGAEQECRHALVGDVVLVVGNYEAHGGRESACEVVVC